MRGAAAMGGVVAAVAAQALRDARAGGVVLIDDGSPEAELAARWLAGVGVERVPPPPSSAVRELGAGGAPHALEEVHRCAARLRARQSGGLLAHPVNRTVLLLGSATPPEPFLPLGDLPASAVNLLAGGYTLPPDVARIAELAGGVEPLDEALRAAFDERRGVAVLEAMLSPTAATALRDALEASRFRLRRAGLVPKLGARTVGVDLRG